jgi:hypothetical protein
MQIQHTKAAFSALWLLTVILAALTGSLASTYNWVVLAVLAAIPPAVLWQLWNPPVPSMSESIRKALKD